MEKMLWSFAALAILPLPQWMMWAACRWAGALAHYHYQRLEKALYAALPEHTNVWQARQHQQHGDFGAGLESVTLEARQRIGMIFWHSSKP